MHLGWSDRFRVGCDTRLNAVRRAIGDSGAEQRLIRTFPRKGVRFVGVVTETAAEAAVAARIVPPLETVPLALPDKPSIAVLPFVNMSSDPEQEYFVDGITEDVITALAKWRWFFVIARNSSFTYKGRPTDVVRLLRYGGPRMTAGVGGETSDGWRARKVSNPQKTQQRK